MPHDMTAVTAKTSYTLTRLEDEQWHRVLENFQDASIFQTIPFLIAKSRSQKIEHLVLRRGNFAVAAAQVRVIPVPFTRSSIAYVLWGPLCHRYGNDPDQLALAEALRALRQEYVVKRRVSLRIRPGLPKDVDPALVSAFVEAGYRRVPGVTTKRTIVIDLTRSLDDLRKGLDQKWRNCLRAAEKNGLELTEGTEDELFEPFLDVYRQMLNRKRLAEPGDIRSFRQMQVMLPTPYKMRIIIARHKGQPCAGAICSAIGSRGLYLFGGTADIGMKNKASYLVQWRAIQWLKDIQCAEYDLHGINPDKNPGVYAFKAGLAGKNGREIEFIDNFESYEGVYNQFILKAADQFNNLKSIYRRYRGF